MLSFLVHYVGVSHEVSIELDSFQIFPALLFESLLSPLIFDFFHCLRMYYVVGTVLSTLRVLTHFFPHNNPLRQQLLSFHFREETEEQVPTPHPFQMAAQPSQLLHHRTPPPDFSATVGYPGYVMPGPWSPLVPVVC